MAYSALGKDTSRTDRSDLAERFLPSSTSSTTSKRELTSYEREALDHITHASDALVIPIYALVPLTDFQIERIISEVKDPEYVEGSGMKFKVVKWRGDGKGGDIRGRKTARGWTGDEARQGVKGLGERELEVEMVRMAVTKRRGLLVFADEGTIAGEGVRICNYVSSYCSNLLNVCGSCDGEGWFEMSVYGS